MQQKQGNLYCTSQEYGHDSKLALRVNFNAQIQTEEIQHNPHEQPIFRINNNLLDLKYNVSDKAYLTHPNLLYKTKIKPQDREKLKSWLMSQTQKSYERETYAMASKYLDMYFSKGHKVGKDSFQAFGIACLILASKVNERRTPGISFQVFNRQQIFGFQLELLQKFNFKVNPVTYVSLCHLLLSFWDKYNCQRHQFLEVKYFQDGKQSIRRVRIIMETLDCMDLVTESLATPINTNVISVFYLQNRRFCLQKFKKQNLKVTQTAEQYNFHSLYDSIIGKFLENVIKHVPAFSSAEFDLKKISNAMYFSRISPTIPISPRYRNFNFQLTRQTYNPQITRIAQNYFLLKTQNLSTYR